jgi:hypothetical protein
MCFIRDVLFGSWPRKRVAAVKEALCRTAPRMVRFKEFKDDFLKTVIEKNGVVIVEKLDLSGWIKN